jgi:hypothetical protein
MKKMLLFFVLTLVFGLSSAFSVDYDAQFVSQQNVPTTLYINEKVAVSITFKNIGTSNWTRADAVKLGSQNPVNNYTWGLARVELGSSETISPGQSKTFSFTITAPSTPGNYNFQWQMLKEYVKWFGPYTPNVVINVIRRDYDSDFISQSVPTPMNGGKQYQVSLTFKNIGTNTWTDADKIFLGSQNPQDNLTWGIGRVPVNGNIATNQNKTFTFTVTAPKIIGNHNFQWQMLKEGVKWFGDKSPNVVVNVPILELNSAFVAHSVPTTMIAGMQYQVSLTFMNTGAGTWSIYAHPVKLGSQKPPNNDTWGLHRVYLDANDNITTNQTKTFAFTVTAPINPGNYDFQWRMVEEDYGWFGAYVPNPKLVISVTPSLSADITEPIGEQSVSGITPVSFNFTGNVALAELYVDGVLLNSVENPITSPYTFYWNTAVNHLPVPNHSLDYGYYGVVGIQGDDNHEVDFSGEVNCYTNSFIVGRAGYKYITNWATLMDGDLALAVSQGRDIELGLDMNNTTYMSETNPSHLDQVLNVAAPYWDHIVRVEIAGEPTWDQANTEARVLEVQNALIAHGLSYRPLGVMLYHNCSNFDAVANAAGLDWIGIEAYLDGPGDDISQNNIDNLYNIVNIAMNRVPIDRAIIFAQMSYNRNSSWTNMDTLRDLQIPTYLLTYNNPRVIAIRMFAYSRPSGNQGARENPVLKTPQIMVGEKILNVINPYSGQGRRTLMVKVFDASGDCKTDSVIVNVGQTPPTNACE